MGTIVGHHVEVMFGNIIDVDCKAVCVVNCFVGRRGVLALVEIHPVLDVEPVELPPGEPIAKYGSSIHNRRLLAL